MPITEEIIYYFMQNGQWFFNRPSLKAECDYNQSDSKWGLLYLQMIIQFKLRAQVIKFE